MCSRGACETWLQAKAQETGMMLAYRTVQYPQLENVTESGAAIDHQIGHRFHVTYLNAAGREVRRSRDPYRHNSIATIMDVSSCLGCPQELLLFMLCVCSQLVSVAGRRANMHMLVFCSEFA